MKGKAKQIKYALIGLTLIAVILSAAYFYRKSGRPTAELMNYNELVGHIDHGDIKSALIQPNEVTVTLNEGRVYRVTIFPNLQLTSLADHVHEKNPTAAIKFEVPEERIQTNEILLMLFVFLCIVGFLFAVRQMRSGNGIASSFGQNRAKPQPSQNGRITFSDVAGVEEATAELSEIVDFLKQPQRFQSVGGRIPKGVLLMGPPGTGKTLLARAIAGEANVPFFSISGSDFVEMYVGVGASRVRGLFNQAKKKAPCIIFIDEIDSIGRQRGASSGGASDEREQTLNQLLVEMDGFEANKGIILIGSTNRPDILDNALLRPGRFDRRVMVDRPDVRGREQILAVHARKVPLDTDVRISVIARGTPGFTGADLANLINEAALNAARQNRKTVLMSDFEMAKDKVLMGAERRSAIISDDEKRTTAYHEAGHTLVGLKVPNADPIHKVTIIPRGMALGVTQQLPEGDRYLQSRDFIEGQIAILMGGRIAEEVFLGQMTTGASNDIERATELARKMVCKFGMSGLGPLSFLKQNDEALQSHSEDTAIRIDQEVSRIVTEQYNRARCMITENRTALERLAETLLKHESLDGLQIRRIVAGHATDGEVTMPATNEGDVVIVTQAPPAPMTDICHVPV